jgi:hypothetical protein
MFLTSLGRKQLLFKQPVMTAPQYVEFNPAWRDEPPPRVASIPVLSFPQAGLFIHYHPLLQKRLIVFSRLVSGAQEILPHPPFPKEGFITPLSERGVRGDC